MFNRIIKWIFWALVAVFLFWPAVILAGIAIAAVVVICAAIAVIGLLLLPVAAVLRLLRLV